MVYNCRQVIRLAEVAALGIEGKKKKKKLNRVGQCGPWGNQVSALRHSARHRDVVAGGGKSGLC